MELATTATGFLLLRTSKSIRIIKSNLHFEVWNFFLRKRVVSNPKACVVYSSKHEKHKALVPCDGGGGKVKAKYARLTILSFLYISMFAALTVK